MTVYSRYKHLSEVNVTYIGGIGEKGFIFLYLLLTFCVVLDQDVNPFSPRVLEPDNYPGPTAIFWFFGPFYMSPSINVELHIEQAGAELCQAQGKLELVLL